MQSSIRGFAVACGVSMAVGMGAAFGLTSQAHAAKTPQIQLSANNFVPACVVPERLTAFVRKRFKKMPKRFDEVAVWYERHGEAVGVRWDYAFFQMIVETNWLRFHRPNGSSGDVDPRQNNFAGIGATGGGVPGERFPTVADGVLAHLHHILMYSGKMLDNPRAKRTAKVQSWIVPWAKSFGRPMTYTDLTVKWSPTDKEYSDDIESIARRYRKEFCKPGEWTKRLNRGARTAAATSQAVVRTAAAPISRARAARIDNGVRTASASGTVGTGRPAGVGNSSNIAIPCKVFSAAFDNAGSSVLLRTGDTRQVRYTALGVETGQEALQMQAFINQHAQGGVAIAQFGDARAALQKALKLCPQQ
ncbi:MAG: glucosaminidase domain-containing protein [Pseudomonadota bacterium]